MFDNQYYNRDRQMKTGGNGRQAQEEASFRKATADTQFFWNQVTRNNGTVRKLQRVLNPQLRAREESQLFGNHTDVLQGVIQDSTPVERSGPGADTFPVLEKFSDLNNLPSFIARNIRLMRYESPSPIQKHSVPLGLAGLDLMCCAQTGSGKTFAFLLPVITSIFTFEEPAGQERCPSPTLGQDAESGGGIRSPSQLQGQIDERGCMPKAIILAPTRELACQIHTESKKLCHNSDMKTVVVYGGSDIRAQLSELSTGCDMIVATPGRLNDLVDRGVVSFCKVIFLVLDEADRMLDMGFEPQIRRIVQENDMPSKDTRQTFLFSATFPDEIQSLAREFLRDYVWIGVGRVGSTVENIEQRLMEASSDPNVKLNMLLAAINEIDGRTLVFVQKKRTAAWVCQCLQQYGVPAEEIHGDRTQMQREHALRQFREGRTRVLVATDVAARGLDVPAVTHVIQFDMPISSEDFDTYVHRIGRTGRAGKSGVATSFYVAGRETGEGNGKIAQLILRLLQENNQVIPDWFMAIDDHRYGGGGSVRRPPFNSGQQGRGPSFGSRDVRGHQAPTQQMNYGPGSYNSANRGPKQQGMVRGPMQIQGQYKPYGDTYQQQGPGGGMQYQNQGGYQADNQQQQQQQQIQQQQQQQPYLRSPQLHQQNTNGPRYASQPQSQVGSNPQYGQQVASYGGMMPAQNYIPPPAPGAVPQSAFYDNNYGMVYVPPAGLVAGPVDGITSQMAQVQIHQQQQQQQQQRGNYSSNRPADSTVPYSTGMNTASRSPIPQNVPYQQGYSASPSMPGAGAHSYDQQGQGQGQGQGGYPSPQAQGHTNPYMQGQQPQRNGYPGNFSPTGRMGRGMGGRALNVDARPFKASGIAMGQAGREYQNQGPDQGQGQGHPSEQAAHHTGGMSNISYSPSAGAYAPQSMTPYTASAGSGNPAGNNTHNLQSPHSDAHSPTTGDAGSGGRGAAESGQPPSVEPSASA